MGIMEGISGWKSDQQCCKTWTVSGEAFLLKSTRLRICSSSRGRITEQEGERSCFYQSHRQILDILLLLRKIMWEKWLICIRVIRLCESCKCLGKVLHCFLSKLHCHRVHPTSHNRWKDSTKPHNSLQHHKMWCTIHDFKGLYPKTPTHNDIIIVWLQHDCLVMNPMVSFPGSNDGLNQG